MRMQTKRKTALRELTLSAVNHCTAINKEKIILSLFLFLLLDYGYVGSVKSYAQNWVVSIVMRKIDSGIW